MNESITAIAIDGPAGAGKSTIARAVAKKMGYIYVDTGAMYRAMALYLIREKISPDDREKIEKACDNAVISIDHINGEQVVLLGEENVNGLIRTEEVSSMASKSSANERVRAKLVALQQELAAKRSVVMDGRDIGTKVLPNAAVKIFLTADADVRAKRRYDELTSKGVSCDLNEIKKDITERDHQDMTRAISPLKKADDAILVDTSAMTIEEVTERILSIINSKSV
ncbi:MAG: (d)CMP kinase [Lachnospiraceae bacterium]|nr:(d)CMP kinase [Lachnospiraceae bacterium]